MVPFTRKERGTGLASAAKQDLPGGEGGFGADSGTCRGGPSGGRRGWRGGYAYTLLFTDGLSVLSQEETVLVFRFHFQAPP